MDSNVGNPFDSLVAAEHHCGNDQLSITTVNGIPAVHRTAEICDNQVHDSNLDVYYFFTSNGTETDVMLLANTNNSASYDKNLGDFQSSVKTVKLDNAEAAWTGIQEGLGLKATYEPIRVQNTDQNFALESSSNISDFKFSDTDKQISFIATGPVGNYGFTSFNADSLLGAPYTMTVDGKPGKLLTIQDQTSGKVSVVLGYLAGTHQITVTGSSVVPEFQVAMIPLVAGVIGVILVTRNSLTKNSNSGI